MSDEYTTDLKLRPVCDCGHVFNELTVKDNQKPMPPEFTPRSCPKCGRRITSISGKIYDSKNNVWNFEY